jgi:hypothetical protein
MVHLSAAPMFISFIRMTPFPAAFVDHRQFAPPVIIGLNDPVSGARFTCDLPVLPAVCSIDNYLNMAEGSRTQIKRAYELSVCRRNALTDARIASPG